MARTEAVMSITCVLVLAIAVFVSTAAAESFDYSHFGKDWAGLCRAGAAQSPINIITRDAKHTRSTRKFYLDYEPSSKVTVTNTGHSITCKLADDSNNYLHTHEGRFRLSQFHFHVFSEHAVNGLFAPMEIHFVHTSEDKTKLSVLGVLARVHPDNEENPFFSQFFSMLPNNTVIQPETTLDIEEFIKPRGSPKRALNYYTYPGSLTTPPCSEIVTWYVLKKYVKISIEQIVQISEADGAIEKENRINDRLPVPLGDRTLKYTTVY